MKKVVLLSSALFCALSLAAGAQEAPKAAEGKPDKAAKQDRVEGGVVRFIPEHSHSSQWDLEGEIQHNQQNDGI